MKKETLVSWLVIIAVLIALGLSIVTYLRPVPVRFIPVYPQPVKPYVHMMRIVPIGTGRTSLTTITDTLTSCN